ncbi:MAG: hypothetical protein ABIF10_07985 [Candidatus Woesearchaeota archaeon]
MVHFVFSPQWFYGIDSIFEIASVLVSFLIAFASFRFYRFSSDAKYKYFGWSFLAIAIAFVAKILTNINVYYSVLEHRNLGFLTLTYRVIKYSDIFSVLGLVLYRSLILLGFLGVFALLQKNVDRKQFLLLAYSFLIISILSTYSFVAFHLTLVVLLAAICHQYYINYSKKRSRQALLVLFAMILLFATHLVHIFVFASLGLYVLSESLQLIGFMVLLFSFFALKNVQKNKT